MSPRADPPPDTTVPVLLGMVFRAMSADLQAYLRGLDYRDLRPAHGFALALLARRANLTTAELAGHAGITKQAAAQLIGELHAGDYLRRDPHPTDRRSTVLTLTERGQRAAQQIAAHWARQETHYESIIGTERLDELRDALRHYLTAVPGT